MQSSKSLVYLDNNATTFMPPDVQAAMIAWCNKGNPSSAHTAAREARHMMTEFRQYLASLCSIISDEGPEHTAPQSDSAYKIIFTSGASEANCTIIHCITTSFARITGTLPHVIVSAVEHKSIIEMVQTYAAHNLLTATYIKPETSGHISPAAIQDAIGPNTCLVCVMHANNETGAVNNIRAIGAIAHKYNIPFHCDVVQTFGKCPLKPITENVDSFCISFHKMCGPPGVGALIVKQKLLVGYKLSPYIFGSQNDGWRGGTENLPGLGAAFAAVRGTMVKREQKNENMAKIKHFIIGEIARRMPARTYMEYLGAREPPQPEVEIVFLSGTKGYLPNTILLSVVKRSRPPMCNSDLRADLEAKGIIVSIGSACNTASPKASHVLYAMGADELIRRGAIRVTLGDDTTLEKATYFVKEFLLIIQRYMRQK